MHRLAHRMVLLCTLVVSALGVSALGAQAKAGRASTTPKTNPVIVTGGSTTLKATAATVKFLAEHGVVVSAIAPATLSGTSLTLPVKGGLASTKTLNGVLLHRGAVRFATKTKSVVVRHLTLYKLGKRAHLAATVAGKIVRLANLSGLSAATHGKTATVSGEVHLSAAVAALINKLLNKHVVSAGYDFGSFTSALTIK